MASQNKAVESLKYAIFHVNAIFNSYIQSLFAYESLAQDLIIIELIVSTNALLKYFTVIIIPDLKHF